MRAAAKLLKLPSIDSLQEVSTLRGYVQREAQNRPGVYRFVGETGEVLYVGKSKSLRNRLLSYFRCGPQDKAARMLCEARKVEWTYWPSEFATLLEELRQIKAIRPKYNVVYKRDRHYVFIRLTSGPAPKLTLLHAGGRQNRDGVCYGPFRGAAELEEMVRELSDALGLRNCSEQTPMSFSDQLPLFDAGRRAAKCHRFEIKRCLGPCIAACSLGEYKDRVGLARGFLEGTFDVPIERFRAAMVEASGRQEFERAAIYRDRFMRLESLRVKLAQLRVAAQTLTFEYTVPGVEGDDRLYLIRRGIVRGQYPAPQSATERKELSRISAKVFAGPDPEDAPIPVQEVDELLLVASWFRRHPEERKRTRKVVVLGE